MPHIQGLQPHRDYGPGLLRFMLWVETDAQCVCVCEVSQKNGSYLMQDRDCPQRFMCQRLGAYGGDLIFIGEFTLEGNVVCSLF